MKSKTLKCSNCNKISEYSEEEVKKEFPYSRERLICKNKSCEHSLTVNG